MMKQRIQTTLIAAVSAILICGCSVGTPEQRSSRRSNAEGNTHYASERYADAEAAYTKAVSADPANYEAKYNLALSMARQVGPGESGKKLLDDANKIFADVTEHQASPVELTSHAAYNMGNLAYNGQKWDSAIEAYKQALRLNPDDDLARENLRLAQLKKDKQDNQNDKNQNQNKDNKNDNQNKQDQQDKQKEEQNQNQDQQQDNNKKQPQQPQGAISDENAEKILKAMENEEAATRRRVQEAEKRKAAAAGRRVVTNPW